MNLFRGFLLKSCDQKILTRVNSCRESTLCINPTHLKLDVKPIHVQIAKTILKTDILPGIPFLEEAAIALDDACFLQASLNNSFDTTIFDATLFEDQSFFEESLPSLMTNYFSCDDWLALLIKVDTKYISKFRCFFKKIG